MMILHEKVWDKQGDEENYSGDDSYQDQYKTGRNLSGEKREKAVKRGEFLFGFVPRRYGFIGLIFPNVRHL